MKLKNIFAFLCAIAVFFSLNVSSLADKSIDEKNMDLPDEIVEVSNDDTIEYELVSEPATNALYGGIASSRRVMQDFAFNLSVESEGESETVDYVAQIGSENFTSLQDAFNAADLVEEASTSSLVRVKMLVDIELESELVSSGYVVLDLNGHTLKAVDEQKLDSGDLIWVKSGALVVESTSNESFGYIKGTGMYAFYVNPSAILQLGKNIVVSGNYGVVNYGTTILTSNARITNTGIGIYNIGKTMANGGSSYGSYGIYSNNGTVNISGTANIGGASYGIYAEGNKNYVAINIIGGKVYSSKNAVYAIYNTSVNVSGGEVLATADRAKCICAYLGAVTNITGGSLIMQGDDCYGAYVAFGGLANISGGSISPSESATNTHALLVYGTGSGYESYGVGKAIVSGDAYLSGEEGVYITTYGEFEMNGGTIEAVGYGIVGNGTNSEGEAYNGGTVVKITNGDVIATEGWAISQPQYGDLIITGGNIKGKYTAVEIKSGNVNISGGNFEQNPSNESGVAVGQHDGTIVAGAALALVCRTSTLGGYLNNSYYGCMNVNITGGTFKAVYPIYKYHHADANANEKESMQALSISDGTFITKDGVDEAGNPVEPKAIYIDENCGEYKVITGGTYSSDVSDYIAPNYSCILTQDAKYIVKLIEEAIEIANNDSTKTVVLVTDVDNVNVVSGTVFNLETNNHRFKLKTGVLKKTDNNGEYKVETKANDNGTYVQFNGEKYDQLDVNTLVGSKKYGFYITATGNGIVGGSKQLFEELDLTNFEIDYIKLNYIITGVPHGVVIEVGAPQEVVIGGNE